MKCVSPIGCPVAAGECQRENECYIWRCSHQHAPKPEPAAAQAAQRSSADEGLEHPGPAPAAATDEDLLAEFAKLVLAVNAARGVA